MACTQELVPLVNRFVRTLLFGRRSWRFSCLIPSHFALLLPYSLSGPRRFFLSRFVITVLAVTDLFAKAVIRLQHSLRFSATSDFFRFSAGLSGVQLSVDFSAPRNAYCFITCPL